MLIIPDAIAAELVTFEEVVDCIEAAFSELDQGRSTLFDVDVPAQAKTIGECQHAWRLGLLDAAQLEHRTLGRLVNRKVAGREHAHEITIFDSSGMALPDLVVAHRVYRRALQRDDLTTVSLL